MRTYAVYMHTNKANGKKYIGLTSMEPERRWEKGKNYKYNKHFYNSIVKHGWDGFNHDIVVDGLTREEAETLEINLIKELNTISPNGYNNTYGGESNIPSPDTRKRMSEARRGKWAGKNNPMYGMTGTLHPRWNKSHSEETRKKLSESHKGKQAGNDNPFYGKKHSAETKHKMSKAWQGRIVTEETKIKMSKATTGSNNPFYNKKHSLETRTKWSVERKGKPSPNKGKVMSEESRKKMSESKKGKYTGADSHRAKAVINLSTGIVYDTMREAGEATGCSQPRISDCCRGVRKTTGKHPETGERMRWMYYEDYIKNENI